MSLMLVRGVDEQYRRTVDGRFRVLQDSIDGHWVVEEWGRVETTWWPLAACPKFEEARGYIASRYTGHELALLMHKQRQRYRRTDLSRRTPFREAAQSR